METVGTRIRTWRRRRSGMSQKTLADLSGLSQGYISLIESGQKPLDRRSTQVAIAQALNISVAQLLGNPAETADPVRDRAVAHVPAIRDVLIELTHGERRSPRRDLDAVRAAVQDVTGRRNAADYAALAPVLPDLLLDLGGHGTAAGPEMVETLFAARYALRTMGYADLAREASQIGVRVARDLDDPAWIGQAEYSLVQAFPAESAETGYRLIARAADQLQQVPGKGSKEVYGCLHILAAFQAAIALRGDPWAHLSEAADVARSLGEPAPYAPMCAGWNGNWFGPTQVEIWRVAVAAELGDASTAMSVASRIDLTALPVPNRHVYYWTDLARALAAGSKDQDAMHALARAERAAPQHFRFSPPARDLVATLRSRAQRRATVAEIERLSRVLGLDSI
jgi:transcriptional regulator with XRE-family HTH domain